MYIYFFRNENCISRLIVWDYYYDLKFTLTAIMKIVELSDYRILVD